MKPQAGKTHKRPLMGPKRPIKQLNSKGKLPSIKNQIRGVQRLLAKGDLDPRVRATKEKQLKELEQKQVRQQAAEREKRLATKYHKVRFFERVKIERHISKLQRQLQQEQQQVQEQGEDVGVSPQQEAGQNEHMQLQLHQLQLDLQYVLHFPKGERYVSLFRQADSPEAQASLEAQRSRLRQLVMVQLQEAAAITEADEGAALVAAAAAAGTAAGTLSGCASTQQQRQRPREQNPALPDKRKPQRQQPQQQQQQQQHISDEEDDFFLQDPVDETGWQPLTGPAAGPPEPPDNGHANLPSEVYQSQVQASGQGAGGSGKKVQQPRQRQHQQQQPVQHLQQKHQQSQHQQSANMMPAAAVDKAAGASAGPAQPALKAGLMNAVDSGSSSLEEDEQEEEQEEAASLDISAWLELQRKKASPLLANGNRQGHSMQTQQKLAATAAAARHGTLLGDVGAAAPAEDATISEGASRAKHTPRQRHQAADQMQPSQQRQQHNKQWQQRPKRTFQPDQSSSKQGQLQYSKHLEQGSRRYNPQKRPRPHQHPAQTSLQQQPDHAWQNQQKQAAPSEGGHAAEASRTGGVAGHRTFGVPKAQAGGKPKPVASAQPKQPLRSREEGGRKRRPRNK